MDTAISFFTHVLLHCTVVHISFNCEEAALKITCHNNVLNDIPWILNTATIIPVNKEISSHLQDYSFSPINSIWLASTQIMCHCTTCVRAVVWIRELCSMCQMCAVWNFKLFFKNRKSSNDDFIHLCSHNFSTIKTAIHRNVIHEQHKLWLHSNERISIQPSNRKTDGDLWLIPCDKKASVFGEYQLISVFATQYNHN